MIWHVSHITCRHLRRESLRADRCAAARIERREAPGREAEQRRKVLAPQRKSVQTEETRTERCTGGAGAKHLCVRALMRSKPKEFLAAQSRKEARTFLISCTTRIYLSPPCTQGCLDAPHPHFPPPPKKTVTHTLTRSLEATERAENIGELEDWSRSPTAAGDVPPWALLTRSRRRVGAPRTEPSGTLLVAHARAHLE